jgi:hypothetical protein
MSRAASRSRFLELRSRPSPEVVWSVDRGPPKLATLVVVVADPDDRLHDLLARRPLSVELELRLERRVRLYADRLNRRLAEQGDTDPYDVELDEDLANVIMLLCETKLDEDELAGGLASDQISGRLTSRDVADERVRRRQCGA